MNYTATPRALAASDSLVEEVRPQRVLDDLVLPAEVRATLAELIEEQQRAELLRSHGLEPRHRLLFTGPPGNGKASLAEALAGELGIPFLRVRYDAVIDSGLARVFEHARAQQCVVFFDALPSALGSALGSAPSYAVVVAATSHPEFLDRAVLRRFQVRVDLPPPSDADVVEWVRAFEAKAGVKLGLTAQEIQDRLLGLSYAELEEFCRDVQRRVVLDGPEAKPTAIARAVMNRARAGADAGAYP